MLNTRVKDFLLFAALVLVTSNCLTVEEPTTERGTCNAFFSFSPTKNKIPLLRVGYKLLGKHRNKPKYITKITGTFY